MYRSQDNFVEKGKNDTQNQMGKPSSPAMSLPTGGGAIRGIDEKLAVNPSSGTASLSVPIPAPGGRGFAPSLMLSYSSGSGNGPFGLGWSLASPAILRRTEQGIPRYHDEAESDTFLGPGGDELVPFLKETSGKWEREITPHNWKGKSYRVQRYRARVESAFPLIEQWIDNVSGESFWKVTSGDNITTLYGLSLESRVADPQNPNRRIAIWLASESYDDKGNAIYYRYSAEDGRSVNKSAVYESNRTDAERAANRYLKEIRYGNVKPHVTDEDLSTRTDWMFKIVLDYGDHNAAKPTPSPSQDWPNRQDAFSTYNYGFELRTYRLCHRILVFHNFPDETIGADCLVSSVDLTYQETSIFTRLKESTQRGYIRKAGGNYDSKSFPPMVFDYTESAPDGIIRELSGANQDGALYEWLDLDGEGLQGALTRQQGGLFYKRNLGGGKLAAPEVLTFQPSNVDEAVLMDVGGDGTLDAVQFGGVSGFYTREAETWNSFKPFELMPHIDWQDPHIRMIDLTGDGKADILITADEAFVWYESLGHDGYASPLAIAMEDDERHGPNLVFNDEKESIYLADMSGDGLSDIVRIRNGSICYWPNLGYGHFGKKVEMENAPHFDEPEQFSSSRVYLADVDGSGPADIVYIHRNSAKLYVNCSGNGFSDAQYVIGFPPGDNTTRIDVLDLLGTGTSCLVWSSSLPQTGSAIRYLALTGGIKPHLIYKVQNSMGGETRVEYTPSTVYYLKDKQAGKPWKTKLPFPIQCVSKTELVDHITGYRFASEYSYSHGYYDKQEREFRGFGRVDQFDTDDSSAYADAENSDFFQPPVHTRTWYHLGMVSQRSGEADIYADEYYSHASQPEPKIDFTHLDWTFEADELAEAMRACKGAVVRSEAYMLDGSEESIHPLTVTQNSFKLHRIQPKAAGTKNLVMRVAAHESFTCNYERNPLDPRISHSLVLKTDNLGLARQTATAVYGRKVADMGLPERVRDAQGKRYLSYVESDYTLNIHEADCYRLPVAYEQRSYDLSSVTPDADGFYSVEGILTALAGVHTKTLLARSHTRFLKDDLSGPLAKEKIGKLGLIHRSYKLAFTAAHITELYGTRVTNTMLEEAGYVHLDGDSDWWLPSGTAVYDASTPQHFYIAKKTRDAFGELSSATLDKYDLLTEKTEDPLGNTAEYKQDYRLLRPSMMSDANQNRSAVETDALGMVIATAIMGKSGVGEGDTLADPTTRFEYHLDEFRTTGKPNYSRSFVREEHGAANPRWQESYSYTSGFGQVAMVKAQAEPGLAKRINPMTDTIEEIDTGTAVRWVGTGRVVINNKGGVVKRYDAYFSTNPDYETDPRLTETGESGFIVYDAMGRVIRTENPDGTFAKIEFDRWQVKNYDQNDTVAESDWYNDHGSPSLGEAEPADPNRRAAWLSIKHANTPTVSHMDSLGNRVCTVQDNGAKGKMTITAESNPVTRITRYYDALGRESGALFVNLLGAPCRRESPEKGNRWGFSTIDGKIAYEWDGQNRRLRYRYDVLRRAIASYLTLPPAAEITHSFQVYGNDASTNSKGRLLLSYDQSGGIEVEGYDFKGQPKKVSRRYAKNYKTHIDWKSLEAAANPAAVKTAAKPLLETESFTSSFTADALGRPKEAILPDNTRILPTFNQANNIETLSVQIHGTGTPVAVMTGQDRNARGERLSVNYGNNTRIEYSYDIFSNRLTRLKTTRTSDNAVLQDFAYTYDAAGHKVETRDSAQQTLYFANSVAEARWRYEYDAVYQLIKSSGREQSGLVADVQRGANDLPIHIVPHMNDASAVRLYTQNYEYDTVGNLLSMQHAAPGANWKRRYNYAYLSDLTNPSNRLIATSEPGDADGIFSSGYSYDPQGNMIATPQHSELVWNSFDQLREVDLGGGGRAYYVYSADGMRVRKIIERTGGAKEERLYLGAVEYHRKSQGGTLKLERQTVRVNDEGGEIVRFDTKTVDTDDATGLNVPQARYIYNGGGHSSLLELDKDGAVVTYEEYHPFGTTSYRSGRSQIETSLKRYRFAMKERDEETGLYYCGTRYYSPWLGRWTSADSAGFVDGFNLYRYAQNDPINLVDPKGTDPVRWIVPRDITTVRRFETWARRNGIEYTGTPTYDATNRVWSVTSWRYVDRGRGGPAPVTPPATPPATGGGGTGTATPPATPPASTGGGTGGATGTPPASPANPPIPGRGAIGSVLPHGDHPPSEYSNPLDRATRLTEDEHGMPKSQLQTMTRNPRTGIPDYTDDAYNNDATAHIERRTALAKTNGIPGVMEGDNAVSDRMRAGGRINYREDVFMASRQRFIDAARATGSGITEEAINRQMLTQEGNLFNTFRGGAVLNALPQQTFGQRVAEGVRNAYSRIVYNAQGYNRFSGAAGTLARGLIPGFVEAELIAMNAPALVAQAGITNATIVSTASAAAAAPAAAATVVVASAAGGYLVGGAVGHWATEASGSEVVGAGAGALAGAGTGALIGAGIGSIVPGLGTAAGAIIGGAVGGIAGLIGSIW